MSPFTIGFGIEDLDEQRRTRLLARSEPDVVDEVARELVERPGAFVLSRLQGPEDALTKIRARQWAALRAVFGDEELIDCLRRELTLALMERERAELAKPSPPSPRLGGIAGASEYDEECEEDWCICEEDPDPKICEDEWTDCEEGDCDTIVLDPICVLCWGETPEGAFEDCIEVPCEPEEEEPFLCC